MLCEVMANKRVRNYLELLFNKKSKTAATYISRLSERLQRDIHVSVVTPDSQSTLNFSLIKFIGKVSQVASSRTEDKSAARQVTKNIKTHCPIQRPLR